MQADMKLLKKGAPNLPILTFVTGNVRKPKRLTMIEK